MFRYIWIGIHSDLSVYWNFFAKYCPPFKSNKLKAKNWMPIPSTNRTLIVSSKAHTFQKRWRMRPYILTAKRNKNNQRGGVVWCTTRAYLWMSFHRKLLSAEYYSKWCGILSIVSAIVDTFARSPGCHKFRMSIVAIRAMKKSKRALVQ